MTFLGVWMGMRMEKIGSKEDEVELPFRIKSGILGNGGPDAPPRPPRPPRSRPPR